MTSTLRATSPCIWRPLLLLLLLTCVLPAVDAPQFSQARGFLSASTEIVLRAPPGAVVRYTTDSSWPRPDAGPGGQSTVSVLISGTTVLRAMAVAAGRASTVVTHTYIFPEQVLDQGDRAQGSPKPPSNSNESWGETHMDQDVLTSKRATALAALRQLPSLCIAAPMAAVFADDIGIFPNAVAARNAGAVDPLDLDWERASSVEWLQPDGSALFVTKAGLRAAGNASRSQTKKSMALEFRSRYGDARLQADLYDGGVRNFDELRLRAPWMDTATNLCMAFGDDLLGGMDGDTQRSRFVHVYLNGIYWGLYDLTEQADSGWAEEHLGGDKDRWEYQRLASTALQTDVDGHRFQENFEQLHDPAVWARFAATTDIDQLCDYLLLLFHLNHIDTHEDRHLGSPHDGHPWRSYPWDMETLFQPSAKFVDGKVVSWFRPAVDDDSIADPLGGIGNYPEFARLLASPFFIRRLSDRYEQHRFGGSWDPTWALARWQARVQELADTPLLERARWKDRFSGVSPQLLAQQDAAMQEWLPARWQAMTGFMTAAGLWQATAPAIAPRDQAFAGSLMVDLSKPSGVTGTIVYRLDGLDPRRDDGSTRTGSRTTTGETISIDQTTLFCARIRDGSTWSPLIRSFYRKTGLSPRLRISEIHYHPHRNEDEQASGWTTFLHNGTATFQGTPVPFGPSARMAAATGSHFAYPDPPADLGPDVWGLAAHSFLRAPIDGTIGLRIQRDGYCRLYHGGGEPLIDVWDDGVSTEITAIDAIAGALLPLRLHLGSISGAAEARLQWRLPGGSWTDIPASAWQRYDDQSNDLEFIELQNQGSEALDVSGWRLADGIGYRFPRYSMLAPGQRWLLIRTPRAFQERYPGIVADGTYTGSLADGGETIAVVDAADQPVTAVTYDDAQGWPAAADGPGSSLVFLGGDPDDPDNWAASKDPGGTPGTANSAASDGVVLVSEAMTHSDPEIDWIELHNPSSSTVDVSGWYLTDDRQDPTAWRIPRGTSIGPAGYLVFDEDDFGASFRLSSLGEEVWLFAADPTGALSGYTHGFDFGAQFNGVSFARHRTSLGEDHFVRQRNPTRGASNSGVRVGPLVISEVHYHPSGTGIEFVEIVNIGGTAVDLGPNGEGHPWRLEGTGFEFPAGAEIPAGGVALVSAGEPASFRAAHGLGNSVAVYGPFPGRLDNGGETIALQQPDGEEIIDGSPVVPWVVIDQVDYDDDAPWPTETDGNGPSLQRIDLAAYGDDRGNWQAAASTPGTVPELIHRVLGIAVRPGSGIEAAVDDEPFQPVPHSATTSAGADHLIRFRSTDIDG